MGKRTPAEVYQALTAAGWPPAAARTMTAIAGAESGWRDDALGDVRLQDATWGPSYGAFQIRTLKRDTGSGSDRDLSRLTGNLDEQAKAAWDISKHGTDFSPWTTYTNGRWTSFLGQVSAAAGGVAGGVVNAGVDVTGGLADKAAGLVLDTVGGSLGGLRTLALQSGAALLGLALIGAGLAAALLPKLDRKVAAAQGVAKKAAGI